MSHNMSIMNTITFIKSWVDDYYIIRLYAYNTTYL